MVRSYEQNEFPPTLKKIWLEACVNSSISLIFSFSTLLILTKNVSWFISIFLAIPSPLNFNHRKKKRRKKKGIGIVCVSLFCILRISSYYRNISRSVMMYVHTCCSGYFVVGPFPFSEGGKISPYAFALIWSAATWRYLLLTYLCYENDTWHT